MKLEAVIVCINYGDFLAATLPTNKEKFDRVVVVTTTKDTETIEVCRKNHVKCIQYDDVYENDSVANKAIAINKGLDYLDKDGWILQLDADIWLSQLTRDILERQPLDGDSIYGIDRYMCNSYEDWTNFLIQQKKIHHGDIFLDMSHFKLGTRVVHFYGEGYMPIGFFQLWCPSISGVYKYPVEKSGYDRTDVVHLKQFPRAKRKFIPELVCVHLASQEHLMGQNWNGRKTMRFEPNATMDNLLDSPATTYSGLEK